MSDRPRFVFDANTIVSAALFKDSTPDKALRVAAARGEILLSRETVAELQDVLARAKFDRYVSAEERELFLAKLIQRATIVELLVVERVCRDTDDDKYLAVASVGRAMALVSGDADLLTLKAYRGIPIQTPADFLALLLRSNS